MVHILSLLAAISRIISQGIMTSLQNEEDAGTLRQKDIPQHILYIIETGKQYNKMVGTMSDLLLSLYKVFWWVPRCKKFVKRERELGITKEMKH